MMSDMIDSEATQAGRIRQNVDGTKRCPRCGAPLEGRNPFLPSYGRYEEWAKLDQRRDRCE